MEVQTAQREVRTVFLGGSIGQAVSGLIWLVSAALGTWVGPTAGIISLALGGAFIFPLTQLTLRLMGRQASLRRENPFNQLARQVAFVAPLMLPLIGAATLYNQNWFYPAFMIAVGAHYLPFMTLYGMWQYAILAAALMGGGVVIGMYLPDSFTPGGWFTGVVLLVFAVAAWRIAATEQQAAASVSSG
jgi:hypothetical protein